MGWGTGLVGLGERLALSGGALEHGPRPDGDVVLEAALRGRATLPWPA